MVRGVEMVALPWIFGADGTPYRGTSIWEHHKIHPDRILVVRESELILDVRESLQYHERPFVVGVPRS